MKKSLIINLMAVAFNTSMLGFVLGNVKAGVIAGLVMVTFLMSIMIIGLMLVDIMEDKR